METTIKLTLDELDQLEALLQHGYLRVCAREGYGVADQFLNLRVKINDICKEQGIR